MESNAAFIVGMVICAYNVWMTARGAETVDGKQDVFVEKSPGMPLMRSIWNAPVLVCLGGLIFSIGWVTLPWNDLDAPDRSYDLILMGQVYHDIVLEAGDVETLNRRLGS